MLKFMRENAGSWLIKIILGLIVVVFVFFGMGSMGAKKRNQVALVNDMPITMEAYKRSYQGIIDQMRQRFGDNLNDELLEMLQVRKQALDRLIEEKLISQEADNLDIQVTDEALQNVLSNINAFQKNDRFDIDTYKRVLLSNRLNPENFEAMQRESMRQSMVRETVFGSVKVSDLEAAAWYREENTQTAIAYVSFESDAFDVSPEESALKEYYSKNQDKFKSEPQLKVQYLEFMASDYKDQVSITDEKINLYYKENSEEFSTPEQVEASHILIKVDENADADTVEKARLEAVAVYEKASAGEDFAELAKKYSQGPSKDNGGYLGKFEKNAMVKPFAEKAFSMKAGDVSEPVKTRFGWHVIHVKSRIDASVKSLEDATKEIGKKLADAEMKNMAYDLAGKSFDAVIDGDDLEQAALIVDEKILEVGPFTIQGPEGDFKNKSLFARTAFGLTVGDVSDVKEIGDAYYIIKPVERIEPAVLPYEEVKERVKIELTAKLQDEKAKDAATAFLETAKKFPSLEDAVKDSALVLKETPLFLKNGNIPELGRNPEIADAAFKLSEKDWLYAEVLKGAEGYYVISYKDKKVPEPSVVKENIDSVKDRLTRTKQGRTYEAWIQALKDKSKIEIQDGFLN